MLDKILKNQKETLTRHKINHYTDLELNVIRKICTEEFFQYYFMYCQNDKIWEDLANRLHPEEKIFYSCVSESCFEDLGLKIIKPTIVFFSDHNNLHCYKGDYQDYITGSFNYIRSIKLSLVKSIDYSIDLSLSDMNIHGIFSNGTLELDNGLKVSFFNIYTRSVELMKQMRWADLEKLNININDIEMRYNISERQANKIQQLYNTGLIDKKRLTSLLKIAKLSKEEVNKILYLHLLKSI